MSNTLESLHRQIEGAAKLRGIVSSMKALAASNVAQFERAVESVVDYYQTVELSLVAAFRQSGMTDVTSRRIQTGKIGLIVLGSDQGLVGRFNEQISEFAVETYHQLEGIKQVWVVGERVLPYLTDSKVSVAQEFSTPNSVTAIAPLIGNILSHLDDADATRSIDEFYVVYNRPTSRSSFMPAVHRVLPLDHVWSEDLSRREWPTRSLPETLNSLEVTFPALIREYLFVSLFKACAESLASENASRLAAMRRADKNIDEMLTDLGQSFHQLRQASIDAELFDLIAGFEAVALERA